MRTVRTSVLPLALLLLLLPVGCKAPGGASTQPSKTPTQRLADANALVKTAYNAVANARDAGWIKQADISRYSAVYDAIDAGLDQAQADLNAGNLSAADAAVNEVLAGLAKLQPLIDAANKKGDK